MSLFSLLPFLLLHLLLENRAFVQSQSTPPKTPQPQGYESGQAKSSPPKIPQPQGFEFDYVIVGSGPGGSVTANRLTENPDVSVAIIEAGNWAEDTVGNLTNVPGYSGVFAVKAADANITAADWGFLTTPQKYIGNQILRYPRAKLLGGSTNLNAMAWGESSSGAFKKWADQIDDQSWTYANIAQYYKKNMNFTPPADTRFLNTTPSYSPAQTRKGGVLDVTYPAYGNSWTTWTAAALDGIGVKNTDSFLNGALNGSAWHTATVNHTTGFRVSADRAYLRPYLLRPNLAIFNGTLAEKVLFNSGKKATGVQVTTKGKSYTLRAKKEVIVSGGVFQTPQLLQVSGVGPAALLKKYKIPVVADRRGVGQSMKDHLFFGISYRVNVPTFSTQAVGAELERDVERFNKNATGRLTNPGGEYSGFEKVPKALRTNFAPETVEALKAYPQDWPEIEYLSLPSFVGDLATTVPPTDGYNYATILTALMTPTSNGSVAIQSAKMADAPLIDPNYLATRADIDVAVAMFKRLREVWAVKKIQQEVVIGEEYFPGKKVGKTDEEIERWVRANMIPVSHATSTCKMGRRDDEDAVVDGQGKVYGVKNLRVIDASAMPFLVPGAAPQAAVYMLAEKISEDIKKGLGGYATRFRRAQS